MRFVQFLFFKHALGFSVIFAHNNTPRDMISEK